MFNSCCMQNDLFKLIAQTMNIAYYNSYDDYKTPANFDDYLLTKSWIEQIKNYPLIDSFEETADLLKALIYQPENYEIIYQHRAEFKKLIAISDIYNLLIKLLLNNTTAKPAFNQFIDILNLKTYKSNINILPKHIDTSAFYIIENQALFGDIKITNLLPKNCIQIMFLKINYTTMQPIIFGSITNQKIDETLFNNLTDWKKANHNLKKRIEYMLSELYNDADNIKLSLSSNEIIRQDIYTDVNATYKMKYNMMYQKLLTKKGVYHAFVSDVIPVESLIHDDVPKPQVNKNKHDGINTYVMDYPFANKIIDYLASINFDSTKIDSKYIENWYYKYLQTNILNIANPKRKLPLTPIAYTHMTYLPESEPLLRTAINFYLQDRLLNNTDYDEYKINYHSIHSDNLTLQENLQAILVELPTYCRILKGDIKPDYIPNNPNMTLAYDYDIKITPPIKPYPSIYDIEVFDSKMNRKLNLI